MLRALAKLRATWEDVRTKLWFIPSVMVVFVVLLSYLLLYIDQNYADYVNTSLSWLFSGSPSAARSVLSTIAGSVITTISIAFSLTIVALQQASAQFTPRAMRNFTSDKGNQTVLGAYIATFVYSLLVLKAVRDPSEDGGMGFAAPLSTSAAILLVLICIGLLIYFISHIATSLQTSTILRKLHAELLSQISKLYPSQIGQKAGTNNKTRTVTPSKSKDFIAIKAESSGFVLSISEGVLDGLSLRKSSQLHILPQIGDFIIQGQVIAKLYGYKRIEAKDRDLIRSTVTLDGERSLLQDPLFAIRQLVDIGLKALSPGINDPTTACYCLGYLGDGLAQLMQGQFPSQVRDLEDSKMLVIINRPTWDDFVTKSFAQLQAEARDDLEVTSALLDVLSELTNQITDKEHAEPIKSIVENAQKYINESTEPKTRRTIIESRLKQLRKQLNQFK